MTDFRHKKRRSGPKASATGSCASRTKPSLKAAEKTRDQRQKAGSDQANLSRQLQSSQETDDHQKPSNHPAAVKSP